MYQDNVAKLYVQSDMLISEALQSGMQLQQLQCSNSIITVSQDLHLPKLVICSIASQLLTSYLLLMLHLQCLQTKPQ